MRLTFPSVLEIDVEETKNPIQQIVELKHQRDGNVLYHTLSEPARAEYGGAPFHTHPMPECHKRAADLAGHRPAVTFSGQSDRQHATLAYRRMRLTVVNLGRS